MPFDEKKSCFFHEDGAILCFEREKTKIFLKSLRPNFKRMKAYIKLLSKQVNKQDGAYYYILEICVVFIVLENILKFYLV